MGVPKGAFDELVLREPSFVEGLGALLTEERLPAWKDWLAWQVIRSNAAYLSNDFVEANFDFYGRTLTGTPQMRERWKRGVSLVEGADGRGRRPHLRRAALPARREGGDGRPRREPRRGVPAVDHRARLDGQEDPSRALDKLGKFTPKIGYP
jgi:putative endopeptidase